MKEKILGIIVFVLLMITAETTVGSLDNKKISNMIESSSTQSLTQADWKEMKKNPLNETVVLAPNSVYFTTTAFNSYKTYRELNGQTIKCESLEALVNPDADQVRDFLKKNYLDGKQRYLLILGDENLIPCKYCYDIYGTYKVHSDYYYGDLEGDWDYDNDCKFGEFKDDKVDILNPEFLVGRLPGSNIEEIDAILNRTITFEKEKDSWKRNMLLASGTISKAGDSSLVTNLIDWFSTPYCYNITTMADAWILQKPDIILNETSFGKIWSEGEFGLVYAICHGSNTGLYYYAHGHYPKFLDISDVKKLNPDYPAVFVSLGCLTNQQYVKSLGKELIVNHSVAVIASSTITNPGNLAISGAWAETFFPRMYLRRAMNLGMALQITKKMYYHLFVQWRNSIEGNDLQTNLIAFILYGDPLLKQC